MKDSLLEAAKEILHLHLCEQEGIGSGQPTRIQWLQAVDNLSDAIASHSSTSYNQWPSEGECEMAYVEWRDGVEAQTTFMGRTDAWKSCYHWLKEKLSESTQQESGGDMPEISAKSISDFDQWLKDHNK